MSLYQIRRYFFKTQAAAEAYIAIWPHHVTSLNAFGITTIAYFAATDDPLQVVALVRYPDGADLAQLSRDYMQSPGFRQDMAGFDVSQIVRVEETTLAPGIGSPLP
jgi:NIPSNAP